jgi:hypothetical protein
MRGKAAQILERLVLLDRHLEKVFWSKVDKSGACWNWLGGKAQRYGMFSIGKHNLRIMAHRMSYVLHFGEIPDGLYVLHTCDNGFCVRPEHLFLGTQKDNIHDMIKKGRRKFAPVKGMSHPQAKLNENVAKDIRSAYRNGVRLCQLASHYGVHRTTIRSIVDGRTWANERPSAGFL